MFSLGLSLTLKFSPQQSSTDVLSKPVTSKPGTPFQKVDLKKRRLMTHPYSTTHFWEVHFPLQSSQILIKDIINTSYYIHSQMCFILTFNLCPDCELHEHLQRIRTVSVFKSVFCWIRTLNLNAGFSHCCASLFYSVQSHQQPLSSSAQGHF